MDWADEIIAAKKKHDEEQMEREAKWHRENVPNLLLHRLDYFIGIWKGHEGVYIQVRKENEFFTEAGLTFWPSQVISSMYQVDNDNHEDYAI